MSKSVTFVPAAHSRSPSPTTVAFDLTHKLDGEDVLFALDV